MGGGRGLMMGGAEGGMGTTLMRGVWMMGGMGVAMTDPGGSRTTDVMGGRGMTGTAETTAARTGGGICREKVKLLSRSAQSAHRPSQSNRETQKHGFCCIKLAGSLSGPTIWATQAALNRHRSLINRLKGSSLPPHCGIRPPGT